MNRVRALACVAAAAALALACSREEPPPAPAPAHPDWPPTARADVAESMLASLAAPIHPSDGQGKAWLEPTPAPDAVCRAPYSATIVFETGPLGVAAGGAVFLQVSPFWKWSTPQVQEEQAPGFTRVVASAPDIELEARTIDENLLAVAIGGRALRPGERITFEYGAGALRARADDFAEADSRFWIAVDGDGDGVRAVIPDSPFVRVAPSEPALLVSSAPSVVRPGAEFRVRLAVLDVVADACWDARGTFELSGIAREGAADGAVAGLELAAPIESHPGATVLVMRATEEGTWRVKVRWTPEGAAPDSAPLECESNPILASASGPRIQWADLHGHTCRSDGTGIPSEWLRYARDAAGLDVVALTDHDHWGMLPLSRHPEILEEIRTELARFDAPGEFLALFGFEWTSWIWGHRHVLYFDDTVEILSSLDARTDTPQELWAALRGRRALTVPHHPAGGPIAIDWSIAPDAELEPLVEVCSAHGSSEAADSPKRIQSPVAGTFARDALDRGYRLGFLASGDSHDGHPGLCYLGGHYPTGGLAAVLAEEPTREAIFEALRARRVYATSGPRIVLRFAVGSARMGTIADAAQLAGPQHVFASVVGTAPIRSIELIRKGQPFVALAGTGERELALSGTIEDFAAGDYVYVRVIQEDGGMAWSSPVFVR